MWSYLTDPSLASLQPMHASLYPTSRRLKSMTSFDLATAACTVVDTAGDRRQPISLWRVLEVVPAVLINIRKLPCIIVYGLNCMPLRGYSLTRSSSGDLFRHYRTQPMIGGEHSSPWPDKLICNQKHLRIRSVTLTWWPLTRYIEYE